MVLFDILSFNQKNIEFWLVLDDFRCFKFRHKGLMNVNIDCFQLVFKSIWMGKWLVTNSLVFMGQKRVYKICAFYGQQKSSLDVLLCEMEPGAQLFGVPKNHWDVASKTNLSWLWTSESGNIAVNTYLCIHMPIYIYIYTYIHCIHTSIFMKFIACNLYCSPSLLDRLARQDLLALLAPVLGWEFTSKSSMIFPLISQPCLTTEG